MWEKISKSIGDLLLSLQPNRVRETVHGANLDVQWGSCHVCLEGSRLCVCDHSITGSKVVENGTGIDQHHVEANGSFAHAVLNMIGMLIGEVLLFDPSTLLALFVSFAAIICLNC